MPVAKALYGPLPQQLQKRDSFSSQLARMLKVRADMRLHAGRLTDVPTVRAKGLLVLVHELPDRAREVTAINFGKDAIEETVAIEGAAAHSRAIDALNSEARAIELGAGATLRLQLAGYEGKAYRIDRAQ
jgi:maltose alpha-D-glucosyltransferase/alpha-amylase